MSRLSGGALRLTVLVGESDTWHHKRSTPRACTALTTRVWRGSVFRGIEGFGASSLIPTRSISLGENLPVAVVIVNEAERVRAFPPGLNDLVAEGLAIVDVIEAPCYVGRGSDR